MTQDRASGTNRHFEHTESTTAAKAEIWNLWTDVTTWKLWDKGLKDATIDQAFTKGATGMIVPTKGSTSAFTVTEVAQQESYSFATKLPGAQLIVRRQFVDGPNTSFRHTVRFDGPLAPVWAALLGGGFRRQLPPTMALLAAEAERRVSEQ